MKAFTFLAIVLLFSGCMSSPFGQPRVTTDVGVHADLTSGRVKPKMSVGVASTTTDGALTLHGGVSTN